MAISVLDLSKIGIGPSSSHTGGPMAAAHRFARDLHRDGLLAKTASVRAVLYGSLGLTGKGHGSDKAVKTMRDTGRDMLDKYKETSRDHARGQRSRLFTE